MHANSVTLQTAREHEAELLRLAAARVSQPRRARRAVPAGLGVALVAVAFTASARSSPPPGRVSVDSAVVARVIVDRHTIARHRALGRLRLPP